MKIKDKIDMISKVRNLHEDLEIALKSKSVFLLNQYKDKVYNIMKFYGVSDVDIEVEIAKQIYFILN